MVIILSLLLLLSNLTNAVGAFPQESNLSCKVDDDCIGSICDGRACQHCYIEDEDESFCYSNHTLHLMQERRSLRVQSASHRHYDKVELKRQDADGDGIINPDTSGVCPTKKRM